LKLVTLQTFSSKIKPKMDMKARQEVLRLYGNRLRLRVCGICIIENKLLMISHKGIGKTDTFWCPPGGGIQFGETSHEALKREFIEETGLEIAIGKLLFVNEFMQPPLHALELFFEVNIVSGKLHMGNDPEMTGDMQIIQELKLMSMEEIKQFPPHEVHNFFKSVDSIEAIFGLKGYLG
jgi:8-oxo-dGTP diphosphatase